MTTTTSATRTSANVAVAVATSVIATVKVARIAIALSVIAQTATVKTATAVSSLYLSQGVVQGSPIFQLGLLRYVVHVLHDVITKIDETRWHVAQGRVNLLEMIQDFRLLPETQYLTQKKCCTRMVVAVGQLVDDLNITVGNARLFQQG